MGKELIQENKPAVMVGHNGGNIMKKNIMIASLLVVSGLMVTVGELKAELAMSQYWQSNDILWKAVGDGNWKIFNEAKKNPSKYLTAEQFTAYTAAMAKENVQIAANRAWYNAKAARNAALENLKKVLSDLDKVNHSEARFSYEFQVELARFMKTVDEEYAQDTRVYYNK